MSINPTSPVTGGAQTGFTAPTYTLTADQNPAVNGKQWAVTALGGTQTGVDTHSVSKPFTISVFKPANVRTLPAAGPNGVIRNIPKNTTKVIVRKGAVPATGQIPEVAILTLKMDIPAGADTFEPEEIRAAISLLIGTLNQQSAGVGDTLVTAIL